MACCSWLYSNGAEMFYYLNLLQITSSLYLYLFCFGRKFNNCRTEELDSNSVLLINLISMNPDTDPSSHQSYLMVNSQHCQRALTPERRSNYLDNALRDRVSETNVKIQRVVSLRSKFSFEESLRCYQVHTKQKFHKMNSLQEESLFSESELDPKKRFVVDLRKKIKKVPIPAKFIQTHCLSGNQVQDRGNSGKSAALEPSGFFNQGPQTIREYQCQSQRSLRGVQKHELSQRMENDIYGEHDLSQNPSQFQAQELVEQNNLNRLENIKIEEESEEYVNSFYQTPSQTEQQRIQSRNFETLESPSEPGEIESFRKVSQNGLEGVLEELRKLEPQLPSKIIKREIKRRIAKTGKQKLYNQLQKLF